MIGVEFRAAAVATALAAPVVRAAAWVDALPTWLQWYLRPAGEHTTFTLFPWIGFVFAGSASGTLLAAAHDVRTERLTHIASACAGAALIAAGLVAAAQPSIYAGSTFWTSSPTWFAIRVGILMAAFGGLYFMDAAGQPARAGWQEALARLGRHSLFVYWIHVELVYGYASWLWRRTLPLWGTAVAATAFAGLMYGAVRLLDRLRPTAANAAVETAAAGAARY